MERLFRHLDSFHSRRVHKVVGLLINSMHRARAEAGGTPCY